MELDTLASSSAHLSRRALLLGAGASTAALALAVASAQPAHAATPATPADVIALAKSYEGKTRAQMNAIWTSKYDTQGEWCAIFVSWCLRGTDTGSNACASAFYKLCTPVSASNVRQGDVVWYYDAGHIGLVRSHSDGHIRTVEGNAGTSGAAANKVKLYEDPWSSAVKYARPKY